ncbi:PhoH family protein [Deferrisoma camini]|uniref:PhoH family protein n=1 Tax=Deferrisoma camini TaxID=1035120 RepID=UPI00046CDA7A|nr:PhoH family protein [Deferrisoma camini]
MAKKNYVLDTNVLLHDPDAMLAFEDNTVNIPITVIEEIDRFKKNLDEIGRNARQVSRFLDGLRSQGDLREGIPNEHGGCVRVMFGLEFADRLPPELASGKADNRILAVCLALRENEDLPVVFVTKDTNLRIKANALGIRAEDYERGKVRLDELYTGTAEVNVPAGGVDRLFHDGGIPVEAELYDNQYVWVRDETNPQHGALGRYRAESGKVEPIRVPKEGVWGIHPRNREQRYAMDALLDERVQLVTLVGKAGTGKTLLAIAAGLQKSVEEQVYKRLLVSRPIFPMGRDIGFLPGDVQEKLRPWMQPIFDNVDFLFAGVEDREGRRRRGYQELIDMGLMALEPLTYIRGRSIPYQYIIVDEAQNLTPHEIKTIITRAGEGTKIVLTGDPYQIDNPYIDSTSNGLSYCVERFKDQPIAAHVTLHKGERSPLAELAANVL